MGPYFVSELNAIHTVVRPQKFTVKFVSALGVDLSDFTFRLGNAEWMTTLVSFMQVSWIATVSNMQL